MNRLLLKICTVMLRNKLVDTGQNFFPNSWQFLQINRNLFVVKHVKYMVHIKQDIIANMLCKVTKYP